MKTSLTETVIGSGGSLFSCWNDFQASSKWWKINVSIRLGCWCSNTYQYSADSVLRPPVIILVLFPLEVQDGTCHAGSTDDANYHKASAWESSRGHLPIKSWYGRYLLPKTICWGFSCCERLFDVEAVPPSFALRMSYVDGNQAQRTSKPELWLNFLSCYVVKQSLFGRTSVVVR